MSFKDFIIISQTHFPIINNKIIDNIHSILVWVHIQSFNIILQKGFIMRFPQRFLSDFLAF